MIYFYKNKIAETQVKRRRRWSISLFVFGEQGVFMYARDLFASWLKEMKPQVKMRTFLRYEEIVKTHLLPAFSETKIKKIDEESVSEFTNALYAKELADNSIAQIVGVLKRALKYAVKKKLLKYNPAVEITVKSGQRKVEAFSEWEQSVVERYIVKTNEPRLYGILISLYTGLRIGELLALIWDDVDFRSHTIKVNKTQSAVKILNGGKLLTDTPKTQAGKRTVPFPKGLSPILKKLQALGGTYVVSSKDGSVIRINSYQRTFQRLLHRLKIEHKGFHALRHTYATRAIEAGADMKTLSEILGHSSPRITMERYVHSSEKQKKRLASKVGERLNQVDLLT